MSMPSRTSPVRCPQFHRVAPASSFGSLNTPAPAACTKARSHRGPNQDLSRSRARAKDKQMPSQRILPDHRPHPFREPVEAAQRMSVASAASPDSRALCPVQRAQARQAGQPAHLQRSHYRPQMVRIETSFHQNAMPFGEAYLNGTPLRWYRPRRWLRDCTSRNRSAASRAIASSSIERRCGKAALRPETPRWSGRFRFAPISGCSTWTVPRV